MPEYGEGNTAKRAVDVANAAAAEVGSGPVDTVVQGCDLIRFGLFFDGTGNSREHLTQTQTWHTNPDLLERDYQITARGPEIATINGQQRKVRRLRNYMRGIGIRQNGRENPRGMALGLGNEGVETRVEEARDQFLELVRDNASDIQPCEVWFDLFGFSRGAAAARFFANRVLDGEIRYGGATSATKFMGLFDTVSSIGQGGNTGNHGNVDISTNRRVADSVVHLTAADEIRTNFPLSLAFRSRRITLVGVHADIGGGYERRTVTDVLSGGAEDLAAVVSFYRARWNTETAGNSVEVENRSFRQNLVTITTSADHGLQFIALRIMHELAVEEGVPFRPELGNVIGGIDIRWPHDDVKKLYEALKEADFNYGKVSADLKNRVRSRFAHFSARDHWTRAHLPTTNAMRIQEHV